MAKAKKAKRKMYFTQGTEEDDDLLPREPVTRAEDLALVQTKSWPRSGH